MNNNDIVTYDDLIAEHERSLQWEADDRVVLGHSYEVHVAEWEEWERLMDTERHTLLNFCRSMDALAKGEEHGN